jgi:AcrR family transcriptional regulator
LLDTAERSVEELGVEQLSLRELARTVGVSHAAPRAHFADRQALLEALAERGFERLGGELRAADARPEATFAARLRAVAAAYVNFAGRNPNLLNLMFAIKPRDGAAGPQSTAVDTLSVVPRLIEEGIESGALAPADPARAALLLAATVRGIVVLVTSGSIQTDALDELIDDATTTFIRGNAPEPRAGSNPHAGSNSQDRTEGRPSGRGAGQSP